MKQIGKGIYCCVEITREKNETNSLKITDSQLDVISEFLTTSATWDGINDAIEELKKPHGEYAAEECFAERQNNLVLVAILYGSEDEIIVPYDKFMNLLEQWAQIYKDLPEKVTITMDDEYNFEVIYDKSK